MKSLASLSGAVTLAALAVSLGCTGTTGSKQPTLVVNVSKVTLANDGTTLQVSVAATDATGAAGTGTVQLTALAGSFNAGGNSITLTLANGAASTTWGCSVAADTGCTGKVALTALWNTIGGVAYVTLTGNAPPAPDGGDAGSGGTPDSGTDAGLTNNGPLQLQASKSKIYIGVGDFSMITATTLTAPDGGPLANQTVDFATTLGAFEYSDGGKSPTISLTTGSNGQGSVMFTETGDAGTAVITASNPANGATAGIAVDILRVQQIIYVGTTCQGDSHCTLMGVATSGFHETAQMTFQVLDASNNPVQGVTVSFSLVNAPAGTLLSNPPTAVTDTTGSATIAIQSGSAIGSFSVQAVVIPGTIQTTSPTIGISGGIPTNRGISFYCDQVNLEAYHSNTQPLNLSVGCHIALVDRFNNPIGTGTAVSVISEAGAVPASVKTQAFDAGAPTSPSQGHGDFVFSTTGSWPPAATDPLPAATFNYPMSRSAEPSYTVSGTSTINNPRDGLVTLMAYVSGEEYYEDTNGNGVYDLGEPFLDQGEPCLDVNDNNQCDLGEFFVDVNKNGHWDGPDGQHQSQTTVWAQTHILYTGFPQAPGLQVVEAPDFSTSCSLDGGVLKGTSSTLQLWMGDANLNRPAHATSFSIAMATGGKGSVSFAGGSATWVPADAYGFGLQQAEVDATTGNQCTFAPGEICVSQLFFGDWSMGSISDAIVFGATPSDTTPCQQDLVYITPTEDGVSVTNAVTGYVK